MRLQGKSYREIQERLGIPKSTLSNWLSDVPLSEEQRLALDERKGDGARSRAIAIRGSRIRRTEVLQAAAAAEIGEPSDRELFLVGVGLYWSEGAKAKPWNTSTRVRFHRETEYRPRSPDRRMVVRDRGRDRPVASRAPSGVVQRKDIGFWSREWGFEPSRPSHRRWSDSRDR